MPIHDQFFEAPKYINKASLESSLKDAFGPKISGKSTGPHADPQSGLMRVTVHFIVAKKGDLPPPSDVALAQDVVSKCGSLDIQTTQSTIVADGVDTAIVTCNDPVISGDSDLWVTVWLDRDEDEYMSPMMVPLATVQTDLSLKTSIPGTYIFEIRRIGAYESGFIKIVATEA